MLGGGQRGGGGPWVEDREVGGSGREEKGPERKLTRFMEWHGSSYYLVVLANVFIVTICRSTNSFRSKNKRFSICLFYDNVVF